MNKLTFSYFGCVADVDECKEKLACQCANCKCKNTWGSYDCNCGSGLLYMQEHDICISEFPWTALLFPIGNSCLDYCLITCHLNWPVKIIKVRLVGALSGLSSWVLQLLELLDMQFTNTESGYDYFSLVS